MTDRAIARARLATPLAELARGANAAADSYEQLVSDLAAIADDLPDGPDRNRVHARRLIAEQQVLHQREIAAAYRRAAAGELPW